MRILLIEMASPSSAKTTTSALPRLRDLIEHDEDDDFVEEEEEYDDDEDDWDMSKRMSRLTVEGSDGGDADDEDDGGGDDEDDEARSDGVANDGNKYGVSSQRPWHPFEEEPLQAPSSASLPGTPERAAHQSPWPRYSSKDYASETEAAGAPWWAGPAHHHDKRRRQRMMREVWLDRAWQLRKQRRQLMAGDELTTTVVVGNSSPARGGVAMDLEEVRACKDLGFDLPCDWTVEIPCGYVDTASSGANSPASGSWRISSPGDDPKDVKARLKVWAQAVALTSASRLGS